jgi:phosphatidylinositol glycan class A protein
MKDEALSIAMISDFFYPNVGGVENHIYMLSANLIRRGHKVIVITHSHPPDRVGVRWLLPSLKVYYVPFMTIASSATLPNYFTFLPYFRTIVVREHIQLIHAHASLSSLGQEGILHAHLFGVRTVFTDHSLFGFEDAASILTNKLLAAALKNVDAVICVSHTG